MTVRVSRLLRRVGQYELPGCLFDCEDPLVQPLMLGEGSLAADKRVCRRVIADGVGNPGARASSLRALSMSAKAGLGSLMALNADRNAGHRWGSRVTSASALVSITTSRLTASLATSISLFSSSLSGLTAYCMPDDSR